MSVPISWTLKVFPNLQAEDPNLAAFLLRRDMAGMTVRRMMGMGREFDRLRAYQPGDPYSDVSWKASAKKRVPISIVRQIERTQQVYALVDTSRLSRRIVDYREIANSAEGEESQYPIRAIDRFVNGALALGMAAERQGDRFGMIAFSRFPSLFLKAQGGRQHFVALQNALIDLEADDSQPDFDELFSQVRSKIRNRSLLVVFTHFDDPSLREGFTDAARLVARQHLVLAVSVQPEYAKPLFSDFDVTGFDDVYERFAGHLSWKKLVESERFLSPFGIKLLLSPQESLCAQVVSRYLKIKERQLV